MSRLYLLIDFLNYLYGLESVSYFMGNLVKYLNGKKCFVIILAGKFKNVLFNFDKMLTLSSG